MAAHKPGKPGKPGKGKPEKPRPSRPGMSRSKELAWKRSLAQIRDFAQRKLQDRPKEKKIVLKAGSHNDAKRAEGVRALAELPASSLRKKLLAFALKDPVDEVQKAAWDALEKLMEK